jgi:hypothetical protein
MNRRKKLLLATGSSLAAVAVIGGIMAATPGNGFAAAGRDGLQVSDAPWSETYQYTGGVQYVDVPPDVDQMTVVATGGDGGGDGQSIAEYEQGGGAIVTGTIAVTPGQQVAISVGGQGEEGGTTSSDPRGGWGGLDMLGGSGNGASDHLRTSGAGGGATTIELSKADGSDTQILMVASGGGGNGAVSGDPGATGLGGNGGYAWAGQNGYAASPIGGKGGKAAAEPTGVGGRGLGGSGLGGNGGGGGGGVSGGAGGGGTGGTSAGGGGGSGSSITNGMSSTSIAERYSYATTQQSANGVVTVTWSDV